MRVYLFWGKVSVPDDFIRQWSNNLVRVESRGDISALVVDVSFPHFESHLSEVLSQNGEHLYELSVAELFRLSRRFRVENIKIALGKDTFKYAQMEETSLYPFLLKKSHVREARLIAGGRWVFYSHPFFSVRDGVVLQHLLEAVGSEWRERVWRL
ncbi:hypothetical protein [Hydrogenivirga sp.]